MKQQSRFIGGLVLAFALGLMWLNVPLASSQGVTLIAAELPNDQTLPNDQPASALWQQATAVEVPLSAQNVVKPMLTETNIKTITVRALHNRKQIAFLVTWTDATKNDQAVRIQDFRDAAALQFPLSEGQPYFCMGQEGGNVNIWHWKADWQADITARQDVELLYPNINVDQYPFAKGAFPAPADYLDPNYVPALAAGNLFAATHTSPIEDVIAGGFGTLTAQPTEGQNVKGYGTWANNTWNVIFTRDLTSTEESDIKFNPDKLTAVAFAAWDGANNERNGQKSTSQWVTLQLAGGAPIAAPTPASPTSTPPTTNWLWPIAAIAAVIVAGLGFVLWRRRTGST